MHVCQWKPARAAAQHDMRRAKKRMRLWWKELEEGDVFSLRLSTSDCKLLLYSLANEDGTFNSSALLFCSKTERTSGFLRAGGRRCSVGKCLR